MIFTLKLWKYHRLESIYTVKVELFYQVPSERELSGYLSADFTFLDKKNSWGHFKRFQYTNHSYHNQMTDAGKSEIKK